MSLSVDGSSGVQEIDEASPAPVLTITLELVRAQDSGDPFGFRLQPATYLLRREGGTFTSARLDWDESLLSDLAAARLPQRDPVVLQRLGELLRRFLLPLGWPEHEAQILAASESNRRVHLALRFAAAELYALPWELLPIGSTGQHLGGLVSVLLRYEWPGTATLTERPGVRDQNEGDGAARAERGRVLFAWSAAGGAVPAAALGTAITSAAHKGMIGFLSDRDVLPNVSLGGLAATLESAQREGEPVRVLHLVCHGEARGSAFGLLLNEPSVNSGTALVDANALRQVLSPFARTLRLVVLCACDSGNSGAVGNQLGSIAQVLHRIGIAAVVASRYPLSSAGARTLTQALYQELFVGLQSLESALLTARRDLTEDPLTLDWAGLQLYSRAADGDDTRPVVFRPFRGLLTYQAEHSRFFVGRERETAAIVGALQALTAAGRPRFLVVAGASGSGKSSLVLAGVVPALVAKSSGALRVVRLRPSRPEALESIAAEPQQGSEPTLLVVDQLEEIGT